MNQEVAIAGGASTIRRAFASRVIGRIMLDIVPATHVRYRANT